MTIFEAVIQGIIQGLTEFLPVSSSGHLSVYQYFTGSSGEEAALFSVVLHAGTLIAVIIAFWGIIWELIKDFFAMFGMLFSKHRRTFSPNTNQKMIFLLIVSLLPLFITFIFKDILRTTAEDNNILIEGLCFLVTGVLLYMADKARRGRINASTMSYKTALAIGTAQAIAPLPGISRSGSTLSVGLILGLDKQYAVAFSFIMGIPAVCAALLLDAKDILGGGLSMPTSVLLIGLVTSAIFGLLAIFMVRWLVSSDKLIWFSYYTLALGTLITIIGGYEIVMGAPIQRAIVQFFAR